MVAHNHAGAGSPLHGRGPPAKKKQEFTWSQIMWRNISVPRLVWFAVFVLFPPLFVDRAKIDLFDPAAASQHVAAVDDAGTAPRFPKVDFVAADISDPKMADSLQREQMVQIGGCIGCHGGVFSLRKAFLFPPVFWGQEGR